MHFVFTCSEYTTFGLAIKIWLERKANSCGCKHFRWHTIHDWLTTTSFAYIDCCWQHFHRRESTRQPANHQSKSCDMPHNMRKDSSGVTVTATATAAAATAAAATIAVAVVDIHTFIREIYFIFHHSKKSVRLCLGMWRPNTLTHTFRQGKSVAWIRSPCSATCTHVCLCIVVSQFSWWYFQKYSAFLCSCFCSVFAWSEFKSRNAARLHKSRHFGATGMSMRPSTYHSPCVAQFQMCAAFYRIASTSS